MEYKIFLELLLLGSDDDETSVTGEKIFVEGPEDVSMINLIVKEPTEEEGGNGRMSLVTLSLAEATRLANGLLDAVVHHNRRTRNEI